MTEIKGKIDEAERWFLQAKYDLDAVDWNLKGGYYDVACFLSQQTAEKVLKSLLYYLGERRRVIFSHSTVELATESKEYVESLEDILDDARELDLHYIPARYPNSLASGYPHKFYSKSIAQKAKDSATKIFKKVEDYYKLNKVEFI
ncbi:MAG: HEPN domain-containing protein [Methanosarcinales archaeon]